MAITGLAGSGKSAALRALADLGVEVLDADEVARDVRSSPAIRQKIASSLKVSEAFNDLELREKLLGNDSARRELNRILHAEICVAIFKARASVVEIPLLVEAVLFPYFNETWFISAPREVIEERLTNRLGSAEASRKLLSTQLPQEVKSLFCSRVVCNNGTIAELQLAVKEAAFSCRLLG